MNQGYSKYRPLLGYLSLVFLLTIGSASASSDQSLISPLGSVSLGTGLGNTAPATTYNSRSNDYLIVYAKQDASCSNKRLYGIIIDAVTGNAEGSAFEISDCTNSFEDIQVFYNVHDDEYLLFFKAIGNMGNKSNLYYCSIDGTTNIIETTPTQLIGDAIADPFDDLTISYDIQSSVYALGYHKNNAQSESSLTINYLDGSTKTKKSYETFVDKDDFTSIGSNKGLISTRLLFNGSAFVSIFELKMDDGHEIWGSVFNSMTGEIVGTHYQISPDALSDKFYTNPDASVNLETNEIITVYEQSYYAEANGLYTLTDAIRIQKINALNGNLISPNNTIISPLPGSGNTEDKKLPKVILSPTSNELVISFYGIRFAAGDDVYNQYLHRIDLDDLSSISTTSQFVASGTGKTVLENGSLKSLSFSYNNINNQFNLSCFIESGQGITYQIWRYDRNKPTDLTISNNSLSEELPVGTGIATLSASDPDPEDSAPVFTLVSGSGDDDNSYFDIENNEVKIIKRLSFEESATRAIRLRATDSYNEFTEQSFDLTINNINENPFDLSLAAPLTIEENTDPTLFSSLISVEDDDLGNTHTYSLVPGDSADNNGNFEIDQESGSLKLTEPLNFEDTSLQYVRIRATDNTNLSTEKAFAIIVTDVNEAPEGMEISSNNIPENSIESSLWINVIDPDTYSNYVISEVSGEGDEDNMYFDVNGNELSPIVLLDYEAKQHYSVRLRAFDGVHDTTQVFQIQVTDVNDAPDSIGISEHRIEADLPGGTLIGNLITYDQDENDSHTYTLESGTSNFFTNDGKLYSINSLTYDFNNPENNFYSVMVKTTDKQGEIKHDAVIIEVVLIKDDENPEIRDFTKNPIYIDKNESILSLSISATDNIEVDTVLFYSRPIRSHIEFQQPKDIGIEIQNGTFYVNVPLNTSALDEIGVEYYFKAFDTSGNTDSSGLGYTYWSYNDKEFDPVNETYNGTAESYKIISNPFLLESDQASKIFADYGASSKDSWKLYAYNNGENKEIGNKTTSSITRGSGYWFNKTDRLTQQITFDFARTHPDSKGDPHTLLLRKGWNLIGNPYPFKLDWDYVLESNGLSANAYELFTFNENYKKASILHEFEGGFVFAETPINIDVPIDDPSFSGHRIAHNEAGLGWLLNFSLANKNHTYELAALGMHEFADASFDVFDSPLLPRFINYLDISFNHPEHFSNAFSKDVVDLKENHIWEFVASTNLQNKDVTLSWNAQSLQNLDGQLVLYDVVNDNIINIESANSYRFNLNQPSTFKAIYGDESFIKETLANIKIEALQPYPNPFDNSVAIPLKLPTSPTPYSIECSIYTLMGKKVVTRKMKKVAPGILDIELNEELTRRLEKGIYIYSIKVKNGFLTNKFHGRIVKN